MNEQDQYLIDDLKTLFENVPPNQLRNSLEDLLLSYLSQEDVVLPSGEMIQYYYYLMLFLREVE